MKRNSMLKVVLAGVVITASIFAVEASVQAKASEVTVSGLVTCAHCVDLAQHKGFTRWTWASYRVSQGDDIVLVTPSAKIYNLQGDRKELGKYLEDKATVAGNLDANTIVVASIARR